MSRLSLFALRLSLLGLLAFITAAVVSAAPPPPPAGELQAFGQIGARAGWVMQGGRLFTTEDDGQHWRDRTPPLADEAMRAAWLDAAGRGWVILTRPNAVATFDYALARTADGGQTWQTSALTLFAPDDAAALVGAVHLQFLDAHTGWLAIQRVTSSNFSLGALFKTTDGGATWTRLTLPIGDAPHFTDANNGWVAGGVAGDEFYRTADGGQTWTVDKGPMPALPVTTRADLSDLSSAAPRSAWAKSATGECAQGQCTLTTQVLKTGDGGATWTPLTLPMTLASTVFTAPSTAPSTASSTSGIPSAPQALGSRTQVYAGQGFDSCTKPSTTDMQTWFAQGPYRVWNLYLGGSSKASQCPNLDSTYISALVNQGWKFTPTWVGPQAACTSYGSRMSSDPATAYTQGVAEANAALDRAYVLGLTEGDKSGTVIYYDLEAYPGANAACRDSSKAFINGWTAQLRARGNQAGVYGSPCSSYLSDFAAIANIPDAVWPASWIYSSYTTTVSVNNVSCLSNGLWASNQRLRQYAGGHNETWGGVSINIDSDVLSGPVAVVNPVVPACVPAANQAALFTDPNFAGTCVLKGLGSYADAAAIGLPLGMGISSVKVGSQVQLQLCSQTNLGGTCETFLADDPSLSDNTIGDNLTASASVAWRPPEHPLELYKDPQFLGGYCFGTHSYWFNLSGSCASFNDAGSSIKLQSGWSARLYRDFNRGGPAVCLTATDSDFADNLYGDGTLLNNTASSVEVYAQSNCPPAIPAAPTSFTQTNALTTSVTLGWTDNALDESGFRLYRWNTPSTAITTALPANTSIYTDTGLVCAANYFYSLAAYNSAGDSTLIGPLMTTTAPCPADPNAPALLTPPHGASLNPATPLTLTWSAVLSVTDYYAELQPTVGSIITSGWLTATAWPLNAPLGGLYQWRVKARAGAVEGGWSEMRNFVIRPRPPVTITASAALSTPAQIDVAWVASPDAANLSGYRVYRDGTPIAEVGAASLNFANTGLNCSVTHSYTVTAFSGAWESAPSVSAAGSCAVTGWRVFLPLVRRDVPPPALTNGGFEEGTSVWEQTSTTGQALILAPNGVDPNLPAPHTGSWLARLGWVDSESAAIGQWVTVSPNAPYLSYWQWLKSEEPDCVTYFYDFVSVVVNGMVLESTGLCVDNSPQTWTRHSLDLSAYAGQTVLLQIRMDTDSNLLSEIVVDDVTFGAAP